MKIYGLILIKVCSQSERPWKLLVVIYRRLKQNGKNDAVDAVDNLCSQRSQSVDC